MDRKKRYIIAKGLPGQALLKCRAMAGEIFANLHIMDPVRLAEEMLQSRGISSCKAAVTDDEGIFIMRSILRENRRSAQRPYFDSGGIADAEMLYRALTDLRLQLSHAEENELDGLYRLLCADGAESGDDAEKTGGAGGAEGEKQADADPDFQTGSGTGRRPVMAEKNAAIITELAAPYFQRLAERECCDNIMLFRRIILCGEQTGGPLLDGEGFTAEGFEISPLERRLAETAFGTLGRLEWDELMGADVLKGEADDPVYFTAYGASNETARILQEIAASGEAADRFAVAAASPEDYVHLFLEEGNLPVTLGAGIKGVHSRICILAERIVAWSRSAFARDDYDAMTELFDGSAILDYMEKKGVEAEDRGRLWKTALDLGRRLSFTLNTQENADRLRAYETLLDRDRLRAAPRERAALDWEWRALPYAYRMAELFTAEGILRSFTFRRENDPADSDGCDGFLQLFSAALKEKNGGGESGAPAMAGERIDEGEILADVIDLFRRRAVGGRPEKAGAVHFCTLQQAAFLNRPYIYLCGLQHLTGSEAENAVILDGDIQQIRSRTKGCTLLTSEERTAARKRDLLRLPELLGKRGSAVTLSWSDFSLSELKQTAVPAFLSQLSMRPAGRANFASVYGNGVGSERGARAWTEKKPAGSGLGTLPMLTVTPSAAELLLTCPYRFALTRLLKIREPEDRESLTAWLTAAEKGTLCHSAFEEYNRREYEDGLNGLTQPERRERKHALMREIGERLLREYEIRKPCRSDGRRSAEEVREILKGYVELWDSGRIGTLEMAEQEIGDRVILPGRLLCHGVPDLVMNFGGEPPRIGVLDYKTGKQVHHRENHTASCIQTLLYCMMLEQQEYAGCELFTEYLYPLAGIRVTCTYDRKRKEEIAEAVGRALDAIETGVNWKATDAASGRGSDADFNPACRWCGVKEFCRRDERRGG